MSRCDDFYQELEAANAAYRRFQNEVGCEMFIIGAAANVAFFIPLITAFGIFDLAFSYESIATTFFVSCLLVVVTVVRVAKILFKREPLVPIRSTFNNDN